MENLEGSAGEITGNNDAGLRAERATGLALSQGIGVLILAVAFVGWLWPIGFGGRMPVGGDVTGFSFGLMARLGRAIEAQQIPYWLPDWGHGFPGVAESQMGVYYPPNLILYGTLVPEWAYTISLVAHLAWAAVGGIWAAVVFGVSRRSAWLAGLIFALQGFFVVHIPHHWSYSVGSWLPWAWGLGWLVAKGRKPGKAAAMLGVVLAVQILPGHFQLAFYTELSTLLIVSLGLIRSHRMGERVWKRLGWMIVSGGIVLGLSAAQWVPTLRLARLAEQERSFEYLSGFAGTPVHLVNYLAPLLFHRSPLWRPLAWDPFHTSPEEWHPYVGLAPLALALGTCVLRFRRNGSVQVVSVVGLIALLLSLGPYIPGFREYSQLPGFSFFRASARWSLVTAMAMALLAAIGLDALRAGQFPRFRSWLAGFAILSILVPVALLAIFEAGMREMLQAKPGIVLEILDHGLDWMPWEHDFKAVEVLRLAIVPRTDLGAQIGYAREGWGRLPGQGVVFAVERYQTYVAELGLTWILAAVLFVLALGLRSPRALAIAIGLVTAVDLVALGHYRAISTAPVDDLKDQSPVLSRMAEVAAGRRTVDPFQNLPMAVGTAPLVAYRTLDLPLPGEVSSTLRDPLAYYPERDTGQALMRLMGARLRVFHPLERPILSESELAIRFPGRLELIEDPALTSWMFGPGWMEQQSEAARRFLLWEPESLGPLAWCIPRPERSNWNWNQDPGQPETLIRWFRSARPVDLTWESDLRFRITGEGDAGDLVVVTQLFDEQWRASVISSTPGKDVSIEKIAGGWLGIRLPRDGAYMIQFQYEPRAEQTGLAITLGSILAFGLAMAAIGTTQRWKTKNRAGGMPAGSVRG